MRMVQHQAIINLGHKHIGLKRIDIDRAPSCINLPQHPLGHIDTGYDKIFRIKKHTPLGYIHIIISVHGLIIDAHREGSAVDATVKKTGPVRRNIHCHLRRRVTLPDLEPFYAPYHYPAVGCVIVDINHLMHRVVKLKTHSLTAHFITCHIQLVTVHEHSHHSHRTHHSGHHKPEHYICCLLHWFIALSILHNMHIDRRATHRADSTDGKIPASLR